MLHDSRKQLVHRLRGCGARARINLLWGISYKTFSAKKFWHCNVYTILWGPQKLLIVLLGIYTTFLFSLYVSGFIISICR